MRRQLCAASLRRCCRLAKGRDMLFSAWALCSAALLIWSVPALYTLAQQAWRTEAGSLAPLVLLLGLWSLFETRKQYRDLAKPGAPALAAIAICAVLPIYLFASAIDMVSVMALCVWVAGVATFYALNGAAMTRAAFFPLAFLGLVIPLPYSLTVSGNVLLRDFIARGASEAGRLVQMETAVDTNYIFIDQYKLAIDTACAGVSSTMSLLAIGLLFAHWSRAGGWKVYLIAIAISGPIALAANVLRILVLLALIRARGPELLDTAIHPLSGVLSFAIALILFASVQNMIAARLRARNI